MTPQEQQLVADLFERLASLEREPRDPDAERAIRDGLGRAPNAVYALVQTALIQDEALRRAQARIAELEAAGQPQQAQQQGGFLDSLRNAMFGPEDGRAPGQGPGRGSVPSVRPDAERRDDRWGAPPQPGAGGYGQGPGAYAPGGYGAPPPGYGGPGYAPGVGAPMSGAFGGRGSFLGTAAAAAAGVIGGSLLLDSLRGMAGGHSGQAFGGQGALDPSAGGGSPWGGGNASDSDLARDAGLGDIGGGSGGRGDDRRMASYDDPNNDPGPFDQDDSDTDSSDFGGDDSDTV